MPQLVAAGAIAGGLSVAFAAGTVTAATFITPFVTTIAAGFLGQVLTPLPSLLNNGAPQDRQVSGRSTLASRRFVLGRAQLAAVNLAYAEITGTDREYLHLVLPFCQGPIESIDAILFDEETVGARDGDGVVIDGTFARQPDGAGGYAEIARIHESLGATDKLADTALVSESAGRWTSNHRGRGIVDLTLRLRRDGQDRLYPSGAPSVRIVARGVNDVYDPRDAGTRWTCNPALLLRWLLTLPRPDGFGIADTELNDTFFAAAANLCEERVAVDTYASSAFTADPATDTLTFASREIMIGHGDGVQVVGPGPLPGGLAAGVTYYAIRPDGMTCQLATSYANAMAGTAIDIVSAGSGTMTLSHIDQARYQASGVYELSQGPRQVLAAILQTMAGVLWYSEGKFHVRAGAWITPRSATITAADLAGPLQCQTCTPWREQFNSVRGTYTDPNQDFQPTDFQAVTDAAYVAEDGGQVLPTDYDMQWVDNPIRAQRLAKINLRRARSGMILTLQCKLTVLDVGLWDTVKVTLPHLDLDEDTFRVVGWDMPQGTPRTITLILQAEDSSVYGWTATDATTVTPRPSVVLPDVRTVAPPSDLTMASGTTHLLRLTDGTILSRILVAWAASPDPNIGAYEIQWMRDGDSSFPNSVTVPASQLYYYVSPVEDGAGYYVRVRAVRIGTQSKSDWVLDGHNVIGKTETPATPGGLTVTPIIRGNKLTWAASTDVDYKATRIYEATANNWEHASRAHIDTIAGTSYNRTGLGAGVTRYYWVVHEDTTGNTSDRFPTTASGVAGVSGTTLADESQQITHDVTSYLAGGATGYMVGVGYWLGYSGGAYKMHLGDPAGTHMKWDGAAFTVAGGVLAGALTVNTSGSIAMGGTSYLNGVGLWAGYSGGAYKWHLGDPGAAHIKWDGSALTIKGGLVAGDLQVSATGNVRGGQSAYDTGDGFFLGYESGGYKLSIGSSAGAKLTWNGTDLNVTAQVQDTRPFAAGDELVAASWTPTGMPLPSATYALLKSIKVPRAGSLRAAWSIAGGGGTVKTRVYVSGVAVGPEHTTTGTNIDAWSDDVTVAAADTVEIWGWWSSASGTVYDFTLSNAFNENQFVVVQETI